MNRIKKMISVAVLISIIMVSIYKVTEFLQLKDSDNSYSSFLVLDTDVDVLFLGSSHVKYGIFVMELWNDYGISSFNLGADGNTIPVSYWTLVNALDYQTPQVVVMDVYDIWIGRVCSKNWGHVLRALDFFPISLNKYRMVKDLFDDTELTDENGVNLYNKRWEILWNLGEYHTRWTDLEEGDFSNRAELEANSSIWKGATPLVGIVDRDAMEYPETTEGLEYDELAKDYLEKTIKVCDEKDITLILINTGYDCNAESKFFADSVYDIAAQYDIPYLDYTRENIINFDCDLFSTGHNTHVNVSGAQKLTSCLGEYLLNNCTLTDHRYDEEYSSWWADYQMFVESKKNYLISQSDIVYYLLLLADDDYQTIIEVEDAGILYEGRNQVMLENLGIDYSDLDDMCNLIVIDNGTNNVSYIKNDYDIGRMMNSCIGDLCIYYDDTMTHNIYLDGKEVAATPVEEGG